MPSSRSDIGASRKRPPRVAHEVPAFARSRGLVLGHRGVAQTPAEGRARSSGRPEVEDAPCRVWRASPSPLLEVASASLHFGRVTRRGSSVARPPWPGGAHMPHRPRLPQSVDGRTKKFAQSQKFSIEDRGQAHSARCARTSQARWCLKTRSKSNATFRRRDARVFDNIYRGLTLFFGRESHSRKRRTKSRRKIRENTELCKTTESSGSASPYRMTVGEKVVRPLAEHRRKR